MAYLGKIYDLSVRGNLRGKASEGFIRPTIKQFFTTAPNFQEILSTFFASSDEKVNPAPLAGQDYGYAVAVSGDTVAVGCPDDSGGGSVYIFIKNGASWDFQQKVIASNQAPADDFGCSVDLDGDNLVVGARWANNYSGGAYVFTRSGSTWTEQQALVEPGGAVLNNKFGECVTIEGDYFVAGNPAYKFNGASNSGIAYVFHRSGATWSLDQTLGPIAQGAGYGQIVLLRNGTLYVSGNPTYSATANQIFTKPTSTWTVQDTVTPSDHVNGNWFGHRGASIYGGLLVIGAAQSEIDGKSQAGSVYVFTRSGNDWTQAQKVVADDPEIGAKFGHSVATNGTHLLIGAPYSDHGLTDCGALYVFEYQDGLWVQKEKIKSPDNQADSSFGWCTAMTSSTTVIGNPNYGSDEGKVFIFNR